MTTRAWGEEYRNTIVCIDSYENGILQGRFYNPYLNKGKTFGCLTQFLLEMEQTLDKMNFPQSFTTTRSFAPQAKAEGAASESDCQEGKLATFGVRILFRQNASWQGSVRWMEGKKEQSFRSVLELILLIDSALGGQSVTDTVTNV
jgi:hypothetical protein